MSQQMDNLLQRYGASDEQGLLRLLAEDYTRECCDPGDDPFVAADMYAVLDQMLEAEYQRIAGGAYDPHEEVDYGDEQVWAEERRRYEGLY